MPLGLSAGAVAAIGAGVSAAGSLGGAYLQSQATGKAGAQTQQLANRQRDDLSVFRDSGGDATRQANALLGLNGQEAADAAFGTYRTSPGYQFQLDQGLRAVDAGASAKGMLRSGATLQAEQKFGQGLADSDFTSYYNRLFDMSKVGENAATGNATTTNAAMAAANSTGQQMSSIYGGAAQGISNATNNLFKNPDFQSWLGGGGGGGYSGGVMQDPSIYGQTAGGAGTQTLQDLGFYRPLGT